MSRANSVKKLKKLQEKVDSEMKQKLLEFLRQPLTIFREWTGPLPNLRDMLRSEEVDRLITQAVKQGIAMNNENYPGERFIEFVIRTGYRDEPEVDKDGKPLLSRTTALHSTTNIYNSTYGNKMLVRKLFRIYDRFDVNYANKSGVTHFHVACEADSNEVIEKFLEHGQDPNLIVKRTGESPLHFAMRGGGTKAMKLLLKAGADPSLADAEGMTPLYTICFGTCNDRYDDRNEKIMKLFFRITAEMNLPVQVDARNHEDQRRNRSVRAGRRPGQVGLDTVALGSVERQQEIHRTDALRRGANPNLASKDGSTPLHVISQVNRDTCWLKMLFELGGQEHESVRVDVRDNKGRTPLHLALLNDNGTVAASLLRRGADPNLANDAGETCLHVISKGHHDNLKLVNMLLNNRKFQPWQIDARDEKGRTPLQLAVARFLPNVVDALLDRGADLFDFVFPTESYVFDDIVNSKNWHLKLRLVSGALPVVECLEKRGYELDRKSALTIMQIFDNFGLLEKSALREKRLLDDKKFEKTMKKINMKTNLTLYELTRLGPEEAAKQFTYTNCLNYMRHKKWMYFDERYPEACLARVSEQLLRGFYRTWALEPFLELIHYRLPIECCEMILERLHNEDLYNICLAAKKCGKDENKTKMFHIKNAQVARYASVVAKITGAGVTTTTFYTSFKTMQQSRSKVKRFRAFTERNHVVSVETVHCLYEDNEKIPAYYYVLLYTACDDALLYDSAAALPFNYTRSGAMCVCVSIYHCAPLPPHIKYTEHNSIGELAFLHRSVQSTFLPRKTILIIYKKKQEEEKFPETIIECSIFAQKHQQQHAMLASSSSTTNNTPFTDNNSRFILTFWLSASLRIMEETPRTVERRLAHGSGTPCRCLERGAIRLCSASRGGCRVRESRLAV
ncbi:unnamed protein product [Trichogramma brassicae]|uniref:Uncharacterized protein n=1 Tax=Trichogramma brassicae TaxID=86971 RepID=A0A6H5HXT5_9HYME|nr:unnamed protein product [Trichogramma brassicae]